jgi:hypothetical protein
VRIARCSRRNFKRGSSTAPRRMRGAGAPDDFSDFLGAGIKHAVRPSRRRRRPSARLAVHDCSRVVPCGGAALVRDRAPSWPRRSYRDRTGSVSMHAGDQPPAIDECRRRSARSLVTLRIAFGRSSRPAPAPNGRTGTSRTTPRRPKTSCARGHRKGSKVVASAPVWLRTSFSLLKMSMFYARIKKDRHNPKPERML